MAGPLACVIGDMDLVRPLGLAGITCVAAGSTGPEVGWSRYTRGRVELGDLWDRQEETVARLVEFGLAQDQRPVLFYQKDPAVLAVSRFRDQLAEAFRFVVPRPDLVEALIDKDLFRELALRHELPVPRAVTATSSTAPEIAHLQFPVIVKPALRTHPNELWIPVAGAAKALRCDTQAELDELFAHDEVEGIPMVVQELVPGEEDQMWSYHAFVDETGSTLAEFTGRKIRTWPRAFGQSTAVMISSADDVFELGREILKNLDFQGVAKIDFKRDPFGQLHLLEINPRFSLWHHPGARAGVNIPAIVYRHLVEPGGGHPDPSIPLEGVTWCQMWGDLPAARAAGLGLRDWLKFVGRSATRRDGHLDDPGSIVGALAYGASRKWGRATVN